jgi:hypothetical protein
LVNQVTIACCAGALLLSGANAAAQTGEGGGNPLGQCMVAKSTGDDRLLVARWFLAAAASTPKAGEVVTVKPESKDRMDRGMAALFTRLITKDCRALAAPMMTGGAAGDGFRVAGEALGQVAVEELFRGPAAQSALSNYTKYLKPQDFKELAGK